MRFSAASIALAFAAVCGVVLSAPAAVPSTSTTDNENDATLSFSKVPEITTTTIWDNDHGFRNISYFLDNNYVIIDSDIIFGTVQDLASGEDAAAKVLATGTVPKLTRRSYILRGRPWPGAKIQYRWVTPGSRMKLASTVEAAIGRWKLFAPYLQFEEVFDGDFYMERASMLNIHGEGQSGCAATPGYVPGQPSGLALSEQGCGVAEATHELGHVLGLLHEHQRPDRDDKISVNWPAISPGAWQLYQKEAYGGKGDYSSDYDLQSIMHYRMKDAGPYGAVLMVSNDPYQPMRNDDYGFPTTGDGEAVCSIYPCECPQARNRPWNCKLKRWWGKL